MPQFPYTHTMNIVIPSARRAKRRLPSAPQPFPGFYDYTGRERKEAMTLEDREILALFRERRAAAPEAAEEKYGGLMFSVALGVLGSREDAEEAVNDALLRAWNSIPPQEPEHLDAYLAKLCRRAAIDRLRRDRAGKRWGGVAEQAIEELADVLPDGKTVEDAVQASELTALLERFLRAQPETVRWVFLRRYWYAEPIVDIARETGFSQSKVKSMLRRTRRALGAYLEKEDFTL